MKNSIQAAGERPENGRARPAGPEGQSIAMKTILVIEDESQTRENLATILEMESYRALTATEGRAGVEIARRSRPTSFCATSRCLIWTATRTGTIARDPVTAAIPFIFLTAKGDKRDVRAGMNLGADDYLTKPATATDLLAAIAARLERERHRPPAEFKPDFSSATPLEALGLTPREAEVLLWIAQGKSNGEIAGILGSTENTVKKHVQNLFDKLGLDSRNAATVRALEVLSRGSRQLSDSG
jgi:DNA-binding NarL/FixJ family response regulator